MNVILQYARKKGTLHNIIIDIIAHNIHSLLIDISSHNVYCLLLYLPFIPLIAMSGKLELLWKKYSNRNKMEDFALTGSQQSAGTMPIENY